MEPKCGTFTGKLFDLIDPNPDDIRILDISKSLSRQYRFNGHTRTPFSVAQHSILVANLLPDDLFIYGLLHDAHEAYMGDITSPVKQALKDLGGGEALALLDDRLAEAVHKAFNLLWPLPYFIRDKVHEADKLAAEFEKAHLLNLGYIPPFLMPGYLRELLQPRDPDLVEIDFSIKLVDILIHMHKRG